MKLKLALYMKLWLQTGDSFIKSWNDPLRLLELLFRRLLCDLDHDSTVTNMCIRCLERLYSIHAAKIGTFPDIIILMRSMAKTRCIETQHRLLSLITTLVGGSSDAGDDRIEKLSQNSEQLMNDESIDYLCRFVAWGHLHPRQIDNASTTLDNTSLSVKHSTDAALCTSSTSNSQLVWFVAPPGDNPPLPDNISGPFQVEELLSQKMNYFPAHFLVLQFLLMIRVLIHVNGRCCKTFGNSGGSY
jgi:hypothetical protein